MAASKQFLNKAKLLLTVAHKKDQMFSDEVKKMFQDNMDQINVESLNELYQDFKGEQPKAFTQVMEMYQETLNSSNDSEKNKKTIILINSEKNQIITMGVKNTDEINWAETHLKLASIGESPVKISENGMSKRMAIEPKM